MIFFSNGFLDIQTKKQEKKQQLIIKINIRLITNQLKTIQISVTII